MYNYLHSPSLPNIPCDMKNKDRKYEQCMNITFNLGTETMGASWFLKQDN